MNYISVTSIPTSDLRKIALAAAQAMKIERDFSLRHLAATRGPNPYGLDDRSASVYGKNAEVFSEIGHISRAAQLHFKIPFADEISSENANKINAVIRQIDAQVRFIDCSERRKLGTFDFHMGVVSHAFESGRERVIELLEKAAKRLKAGNAVLLSPHDVGVMKEISEGHKKKKVVINEDENEAVGC